MRPRLIAALLLAVVAAIAGGSASAAPGAGHSTLAARASTAAYAPDTEECAFLGIINRYRADNGLGPLALSKRLGAAAEHHSADMAANNYFGHTLADGTTWQQNIADFGYTSRSSRAENIAAGYPSASGTFNQWQSSSGHNANMLSGKFNAIGIGMAYDKSAKYGWYWTTTFGSIADAVVTCPNGESPTHYAYGFTGGGHTTNSTSSLLANDGDAGTSWRTDGSSVPRSAYVWFDLGSTRSINRFQWMFRKTGAADSFKIQVSTDRSTWTTISTRGNAKSALTWSTLNWSGKARYVRFVFANPNGDAVLGYLAEVKAGP